MFDYSIFYKESIPTDTNWSAIGNWDLFISAYNLSYRVNHVYNNIVSKKKYWILLKEYDFTVDEKPEGNVYSPSNSDEALSNRDFFNQLKISDLSGLKVCIDITGFMRPNLMFLMFYVKYLGAKKVDVIYSEPNRYIKKEKTVFSDENVTEVRQVTGFEGNHTLGGANDILIIGTGYDHTLIARVAENKENAKKIQIFGFPSLSADMYQENILRAQRASESVGVSHSGESSVNYFAPANDPFVTANVLADIVEGESKRRPITNLYLCPVGTKAQALGFTIYYIRERLGTATSIIFPFFEKYTRETSTGISRIWKYTVEFE